MSTSGSGKSAPGDVTLESYDAAADVYREQSAPPGPAVLAYLDQVARLVGTGTVLELDSGPGWGARYLESRGPRVVRTDGASAFVEMLRAAGHPARVLDARVDEFGGPYDAVLANAVLLRLPRWRRQAGRSCRWTTSSAVSSLGCLSLLERRTCPANLPDAQLATVAGTVSR